MSINDIFFKSILLISPGIVFNTTLKDSIGFFGIVLIAIGGQFFIIGMAIKERKIRQKKLLIITAICS